jgi:probable AcnD-accessory protein PrpF
MTQLRIPAVYMRGGTSKGVFFVADDLPSDRDERDRILMRVIGTPDRYGKHIDGMGGATSSTSKVVLVSRSSRDDSDVDYLFGQVAIDKPLIDWSGNCGNLTAAVGPFAISAGLVAAPPDGMATVRIWQANIAKRIVAHVSMAHGEVVEDGDFDLDGVAFPSAEVKIEFIDPAPDEGEVVAASALPAARASTSGVTGAGMFPTGNRIDVLDVPGVGRVEATLINAGNPTIFIDASALALRGTELQRDINGNAALLARAEAIRALASVRMRLASSSDEATANRPHTPKLAFVAHPASYSASDGKPIAAESIDVLARIFSMGVLHHAMTGTGAVALAAAAAIPGTVVSRIAPARADGTIRFGHPSGTLTVGADAADEDGEWKIRKVMMSRSARRIMEGWVRVPRGAD